MTAVAETHGCQLQPQPLDCLGSAQDAAAAIGSPGMVLARLQSSSSSSSSDSDAFMEQMLDEVLADALLNGFEPASPDDAGAEHTAAKPSVAAVAVLSPTSSVQQAHRAPALLPPLFPQQLQGRVLQQEEERQQHQLRQQQQLERQRLQLQQERQRQRYQLQDQARQRRACSLTSEHIAAIIEEEVWKAFMSPDPALAAAAASVMTGWIGGTEPAHACTAPSE